MSTSLLLNCRSKIKRGFQNIPIEHLLKLADYYNTSTDYILGRTDDPNTK